MHPVSNVCWRSPWDIQHCVGNTFQKLLVSRVNWLVNRERSSFSFQSFIYNIPMQPMVCDLQFLEQLTANKNPSICLILTPSVWWSPSLWTFIPSSPVTQMSSKCCGCDLPENLFLFIRSFTKGCKNFKGCIVTDNSSFEGAYIAWWHHPTPHWSMSVIFS